MRKPPPPHLLLHSLRRRLSRLLILHRRPLSPLLHSLLLHSLLLHRRTIDLNFRPNALGIAHERVYVTCGNGDGSATMHVLTLAGLELRAIRLRVGGKVLAIQVNGGAHRDEIHVIRGDATLGAHSGGPCNCYEVFLRCGPLCPTLVRSVGALTALVMDTVAQAHESEGPVMR